MADSPIRADHVTYHHHQGPETRSEAAGNYAGAAFLVGAAFLAIGAGLGYIITAKGNVAAKMESAKRQPAAQPAK